MFKGSNVALVTPFKGDSLDEEIYIKIINFHLENGTNGLVPAGTTGESPTLSHKEHEKVIELCIQEAKGKIPVIAGTGSNSTTEAISLTQHAEKAGADGALIVTPFKGNSLDEETYIKIINFHLENGTNGLVPAGTTGESPTLSHREHEKVIELCIQEAKGKIPVIAGTGSNSTTEAISLTEHAEKAGADGALIVTPYYNKPTQEGLYQHYKAINDKCGIPIIIYNIPGRSVIDMTVDTMARLFELKNIVGVKDATGDLNRVDETFKKIGNEFIQLTGEDGLAYEYNKRGGVGCISVTANIAPKMCSDMQKFSKSQNNDEQKKAEEIDKKLQPVHKSLFIESNPSPVKYAAKLIGLCDDNVRLPLVTVLDETKAEVKKALISAELINE
jgi:4-hydroxy-tetrahydrodipicolinate synthase